MGKRVVLFVSLLVLIAVITGCGSKTVTSQLNGAITGKVEILEGELGVGDGPKAVPASGVLINVAGHTTETDAYGNYSLSGVPGGQQTVAIMKKDRPEYYTVFVDTSIEPGKTKQLETITLMSSTAVQQNGTGITQLSVSDLTGILIIDSPSTGGEKSGSGISREDVTSDYYTVITVTSEFGRKWQLIIPGDSLSYKLGNLTRNTNWLAEVVIKKADGTVVKSFKGILARNDDPYTFAVDDITTVAADIVQLIANKTGKTIWQVIQENLAVVRAMVNEQRNEILAKITAGDATGLKAIEESIALQIIGLYVAMPTFSPDGGTYSSSQSIIISCATPGAQIHYTTDGSEPSETSPLYTSPVLISKTTVLRAKALSLGKFDSGVKIATYTITEPDPNSLLPALGSVKSYRADSTGKVSINLETGTGGLEEYVLGIYSLKQNNSSTATINFNGGGTVLKTQMSKNLLPVTVLKGEDFYDFLRKEEDKLRDAKVPLVKASKHQIVEKIPALNSKRQFYVFDSGNQLVTCTATLKQIGTQCLVYLDDEYTGSYVNAAMLDAYTKFFDNTAYPVVLDNFGQPSDVNNDGKISILFSPKVNRMGAAGYFFGRDLLATTQSNQQEIFYMMIPRGDYDIEYLKGTLGHEFQHMVNFYYHYLVSGTYASEQTWLNEGLSEYATYLVKQPYYGWMYSYLSDVGNWSLTYWQQAGQNYGSSQLLVRYLIDHYGSSLTRSLVQTSRIGFDNIMAATGQNDMHEIFAPMTAALYLDNYGTPIMNSDPKYQISTLKLRGVNADDGNRINFTGPSTIARSILAGFSTTMRYGGLRYIRFSSLPAGKVSTVSITGPADAQLGVVKIRVN